jgi:hypothetical protein
MQYRCNAPISGSTVLKCRHCRIHRYEAAPASGTCYMYVYRTKLMDFLPGARTFRQALIMVYIYRLKRAVAHVVVIPDPVCSVCGGCKPADLQLGSSRSSSYSQLSSPAIDTAVRPCKRYSCQTAIQLSDPTYTAVRPCKRYSCNILQYNCQTVHPQLSGPADTAVRPCNRHK